MGGFPDYLRWCMGWWGGESTTPTPTPVITPTIICRVNFKKTHRVVANFGGG